MMLTIVRKLLLVLVLGVLGFMAACAAGPPPEPVDPYSLLQKNWQETEPDFWVRYMNSQGGG